MTYDIYWSDAAFLDLEEAVNWYENQKAGLGQELLVCLDEAVQSIKRNPYLFTQKYKHIRVLYIRRFPYSLHYVVDSSNIKVFGFFHMAQDPGRWQGRTE